MADVTHLLAELIENATLYSPPQTRVKVSASRVANGYVVEIEDRGLGIPAETLAALNDRLAKPPRSTWPTATSSACSSSAGWPPGTGSRSRCAGPPTAGPRPSC